MKMKTVSLEFLKTGALFALTGFVSSVGYSESSDEEFVAEWDSLARYECPEWFRDAKFGIYAHWGPYSLSGASGNTDWYSHNLYTKGSASNKFHEEKWGDIKDFGYKDFVPMFTAEKFDADEWAELYVEAGARFGGPVAEHADGFAMWDSELSGWNAVDMGPKRDIVGEMEKAIRSRGLKFLCSLHHHWKWGWYPTEDESTDAANPEYAELYGPPAPRSAFGVERVVESHGKKKKRVVYMNPDPMPTAEFSENWLGKAKEVINGYSPDLLWYDNRMQIIPEQYRKEMAAEYYNGGLKNEQEVVLTFKRPDMPLGTATVDLERSRMPDIYPEPWLTDTSIARNSWSYSSDLEYYSTTRMVHDLMDIVSKNGCLLLNIAPSPDGSIPEKQKEILRGIGAWLKVNGEAVYESRPWYIYGEGETETPVGHLSDVGFNGFSATDVRFTTRGETLYATVFGWPESGEPVSIKKLGALSWNEEIASITLLSSGDKLDWAQNPESLDIEVPSVPVGEHAFVFKIEIK